MTLLLKKSVLLVHPARIAFDPPDFGVTFLGAGNGLETQEPTTGLILWLNQRGILVDPPAYSCEALQKIGLPPTLLDKVILTQCSADHDVGLMQRVLGSSVIELITTPTIMELFVSKYSALLCISPEELKKLFQFRPVTLGHPLILFGATLTFAYSFFAIPTLNFEVSHLNKSFFFSGSTLYSQSKLKSLLNDSHLFSKGRFEELANKDWSRYDLIFHEAAGEPSQTTLESLNHLPEDVKMKIKVYGVSTKKLEDTEVDLERVEVGLSNTYVLVQDGVGDSAMRNLEIIGGLDIFDQIPLKRICDLVRSIKDVKFKQGEFVVREGTKGHKFYILRRGVCKIYSRKTGKEFSKYIYSGDHFGESAMIGDGIRLANVFAETNVLLLEIDKADFLWCLGEQAQSTAVRLMKRLNELRQTPYSEYLNKNNFLSRLTELQKTDLSMRTEVVHIEQGAIVWQRSSQAELAIFICSGSFEIEGAEFGHEKIVAREGHLIGDFCSLLKDKKLTTTSVKCIKAGDVLRMGREGLRWFVDNNPGVGLALKDKVIIE